MTSTIKQIFNPKNRDLQKKILFTLFALIVFKIGTAITVPGVKINTHSSSILEIIRIVPREEIFNMIINSYEERVRRYIELTNLKKVEIDEIIKRYPRLMNTIDYYQNDEYILKRKRE